MSKKTVEADFPTEIVHEGDIAVLVPKLKAFMKTPSDYAPSKAPVFYNPVMELNRDISVLALQAYQQMVNHPISVCEPLTGSGIRGLRYAAEVEGVQRVLLADLTERAARLACGNATRNKLGKHVEVKNTEANFLLSGYGAPCRRFDAVDIDPFGSPMPFVDSAVRALKDGGLLALTATDMAPLCGVHPKACVRKYGGRPLRTEYCHELAVRLVAGSLAVISAKHDVGIRLVFSHSSAHYVRVYAVIEYGAKKADESVSNVGYILHCFTCFHRETVKGLSLIKHSGICTECGSRLNAAGPLWLGNIADKQYSASMENEAKRRKLRLKKTIVKTFGLIKEEANAPITYYVMDKLCDVLNKPVPSIKRVVQSLEKKGFKTCLTHFNSRGVRTNAPARVVREICLQKVG